MPCSTPSGMPSPSVSAFWQSVMQPFAPLSSSASLMPSQSVSLRPGLHSPGSSLPSWFLSSAPSLIPSPSLSGLVGSVRLIGSRSGTNFAPQLPLTVVVRPISTPSGTPSLSVSESHGSVLLLLEYSVLYSSVSLRPSQSVSRVLLSV